VGYASREPIPILKGIRVGIHVSGTKNSFVFRVNELRVSAPDHNNLRHVTGYGTVGGPLHHYFVETTCIAKEFSAKIKEEEFVKLLAWQSKATENVCPFGIELTAWIMQ
jgi:hypothetical protein